MAKNILEVNPMRKIFLFCLLFLFQANTFAAEKVVVLLDWFLNPSHAPLFVAEEKGYFAAQNLNVTLIGPADPSDPPKLVAAGKADIAITYEPQFIQQVDQGLPLIHIGTLIDNPLNCLGVLEEGPIHSIRDLKGKRIGYSSGSVDRMILKTMLEKNGLQLKDVDLINVHYDLSQALLAKKVDAVTSIMRTFEVIQMRLNGHPARIFYPEKNGIPSYDELIFVVNKNNIQAARWKKFLIAVKQGEDYLQQHPEEMWKAFAKAHPELNDELNHQAWFASLPYFAKNPAKLDAKQWENFILFMQKNGLIKTALPLNRYSTTF
jgi:putative hydroxymethylpyrimidine transport system substrate-binding protein